MRWKEGDYGVTNPGLFAVSLSMLRRQRPDLGTWLYKAHQFANDWTGIQTDLDLIREHLWLGSLQPAVVASVDPGRVAAYSIELDCVVMLEYAADFLEAFGLVPGSRLLAVGMYSKGQQPADIVFGSGKTGGWTNYYPQIADFLSDDAERLAERKAATPAWLWQRTEELAYERLRSHPEIARSGKP